ncbi:MAG: VWA domain-containing protein [Chitinophagales bacterium]
MQFEHITYLYLLFLLPVIALVFFGYVRWRKKTIARVGDEQLIDQMMHRSSIKRKWLKLGVMLLGLAGLIIGLANLRMGSKKEKITGESAEVIICFDVSNSMLAEDVKPNRLTQAKITASQLIQKLASNKIGLIVFAGESFVQMPLTSDSRAALMYLNSINTDMISAQGTAIGKTIQNALAEFESGGEEGSKKGKAIIIITDGESHDENAVEMAKEAADNNIKIIALGVGTSTGAPIPLKRGSNVEGFKKDREGNIILTKLNESILRQLATESEGIYFNVGEGKKVVEKIYDEIDALDKTKDDTYEYSAYANHFQVFLGLGLLLITLEFFMSDRKPLWLEKIKLFDAKKNN